jgi:hypothetical protein
MTISTQPFIAVNVGTTANDGSGDDLRTAFIKVNDNFQYMGNTGFNAGNIYAPTGTVQAAYFIGDGGLLTNIAGVAGNYSNVNVAAYLNTSGYNLYSNVNVAAYLTSQGIGGSYSNVNATSLITSLGLTNYSNVNVAAYTQTMGYQNFGNVNVSALITTNGLTNYSNVNVAAYLDTNSYNPYSNVNVANYLTTYTGAITGANLKVNGNITAGGYLFSNATGGSGTLTNQTAIAPAYQYYALNANVGLADGIGDQRIFNANVFLSATTTYEFECLFSIYKNLAVSNSPGVLQFNLGDNLPGVAGFNSIAYQYLSGNSITAITTTGSGPLAPGSGAGAQSGALLTIGFANVASNVSLTIGALNTAAHTNWASIKGIIATSTAGWISPRVNFDSGAGVCYVQAGSYMKIAAIGIGSSGDSNVSIGTWAA